MNYTEICPGTSPSARSVDASREVKSSYPTRARGSAGDGPGTSSAMDRWHSGRALLPNGRIAAAQAHDHVRSLKHFYRYIFLSPSVFI